jgi:hypothetical protein
MPKKPPAKKQHKSSAIKDWVVVVKDGHINAAIDNHVDTRSKLREMGYTIISQCVFAHKNDALDWAEALTGKRYKKEQKK